MPHDQMNAEDESGTENALPPPSQEGYRICIDVTSEGYAVSQTELPPEPQGGEDEEAEEETLPDLTTAIKHVLAIIRDHPLQEDAQAQFKAGYEGEEERLS